MPNKPRPENRHRMVRVEDELWQRAHEACKVLGTSRSAVMREALQRAVDAAKVKARPEVRWVDLYGIDPNYTDGVPVEEWLEANRGEA